MCHVLSSAMDVARHYHFVSSSDVDSRVALVRLLHGHWSLSRNHEHHRIHISICIQKYGKSSTGRLSSHVLRRVLAAGTKTKYSILLFLLVLADLTH